MQEPMSMDAGVIREDEGSSAVAFIPAIIGGLVGALIGGAIWAAIAYFTDYEVGWAAIGVGFLAGGGVVFLGRRRGIPYQLIAVVMSVVGLGIGKYASYYFITQRQVIDQLGQEAWNELGFSLLSPDMIQFFFEDLPSMLEGLDILFLVLAVLSAWSVPSVRKDTGKAIDQSSAAT